MRFKITLANVVLLAMTVTAGILTVNFGWWKTQEAPLYSLWIAALLGATTCKFFKIGYLQAAISLFIFFYVALTGLSPIISVTLFWLTAFLIGKELTCWAGIKVTIGNVEKAVLGFSVMGLIFTVSSHFKINYPHYYLGLILFFYAALFLRGTYRIKLDDFRIKFNNYRIDYSFGVSIFMIAIYLFMAVVRPDMGHDALSAHLTIPQRIFEYHIWSYDISEYIWALLPMGSEMLYTPIYFFGGEDGVRLLNLSFLIASAFLIATAQPDEGDSRLQNILLGFGLAILSIPLTFYIIGSTFVEPCFLLFVTTLFRLGINKKINWIALVLILGYACTLRITGFLLVPFFLILYLYSSYQSKTLTTKEVFPSLLIMGALFLAMSSINYIYAYLQTGNPIFPLMNHIFQSSLFETAVNYNQHWVSTNGFSNWWLTTFNSTRFGDVSGNGSIGVIFFVFMPLLIFAQAINLRTSSNYFILTLSTLVFAIAVFQLQAYLRYVYPIFGAVLMLMAYYLPKLNLNLNLLKYILLGFLAINIVRAPYSGLSLAMDVPSIYYDQKSRQNYLTRELPHVTVGEILKQFPEYRDKKILIIGAGFDPTYYHYPKNTVAFSWHSRETFNTILQMNGDLKRAAEKLNIDLIVCPLDQIKGEDFAEKHRFADQCKEISEKIFIFDRVYVGKVKR